MFIVLCNMVASSAQRLYNNLNKQCSHSQCNLLLLYIVICTTWKLMLLQFNYTNVCGCKYKRRRNMNTWIHLKIWMKMGNLYHLCSAQKSFLNTPNYCFVKIIIFPTNIISCPILQFLSHFLVIQGVSKRWIQFEITAALKLG